MPSLHELQTGFMASVFTGNAIDFACEVVEDGIAGAQRLGIYRNNVFGGLTQTLRVTYPVIDRLVGQAFFDHLAERYLHEHPSISGDLYHFGDGFADFLARFPPVAGLPYLPDVARLEWACHTAYHAADHEALDLAQLAGVPAEHYGRLRFLLHPAVRLISSPYPLHKIWLISQPDYRGDDVVDLSSGGVALLVHRPEWRVVLQALSPGEIALLYGLDAGATFADASALAMEMESDFDLPAFLQRLIAQKTVVGFSLEDSATQESNP